MKALTAQTQAEISTTKGVELLLEGNKRFLTKKQAQRDLHEQITDTATGQYPFASIVSCIDSRIPTEIIFDQGIGDIFNARIAGNFINDDIAGSLEFACKLAGSKVVMILGHTSCGAVKGACDHAELGKLTQLLDKIQPAVKAVDTDMGERRDSSNIDFVNRVSEQNVLLSMEKLRKDSDVLREMEENGEITIVGAMYDVKTGSVSMVS